MWNILKYTLSYWSPKIMVVNSIVTWNNFILQITCFYCVVDTHEKLEIKNKMSKSNITLGHRYCKRQCSSPFHLSTLLETISYFPSLLQTLEHLPHFSPSANNFVSYFVWKIAGKIHVPSNPPPSVLPHRPHPLISSICIPPLLFTFHYDA